MKTLILVLIIASFIQTTILPVDLVLIILICRSYLRSDRANLFLAFSFGLLLSHLNLTYFGLQSLVLLVLVQTTEGLSRSRLAGNWLLIIPLTFTLLSLNYIAISIFTNQSIQLFPGVFFESLLSLPVFFLVRLWEERFIVRKEIKLRV